MRTEFINTLYEIAKKDKNVILITGDLGFGVLDKFANDLPEQFINAGVAEQDMAGLATGLALEGKTVFTYSIANFPTLRCLEQIRNDVCYHNANVKIVSVGGGYSYGPLGMSHHATEDLSIMRALPNMTIVAPGDTIETGYATEAIYKLNGPCYLRLGRNGEGAIHSDNIDFQVKPERFNLSPKLDDIIKNLDYLQLEKKIKVRKEDYEKFLELTKGDSIKIKKGLN